MVAQTMAGDGVSIFRLARDGTAGRDREPFDLHYVRAMALAQIRLQLAVLSGNRYRALEQIDRLVALDKDLERLSGGHTQDLADERLAIAAEKLALTSGVHLPRLEPAFGAGMGAALAAHEEVEIVEDEVLKGRLVRALVWCSGFLVLVAGVTAATVTQM